MNTIERNEYLNSLKEPTVDKRGEPILRKLKCGCQVRRRGTGSKARYVTPVKCAEHRRAFAKRNKERMNDGKQPLAM